MAKFNWDQYPVAGSGDSPSPPPAGGSKSAKFDWDQYPAQGNDSGVDPQAAVQGFGQFATAGYIPELTGALGKLIPDPSADVNAKLKAQGIKISEPDFQGVTTDESRAMQKQMASDSPYSYYGGGIAGAVASAPAFNAALKGLGVAKTVAPAATLAADAPMLTRAGTYASNLGARALQAGKEGATIGFASNPNTEQGDDGLNLGKRMMNAGVTGAVSGAIPAAGDLISGTFNAGKSANKWVATKLLSSFGGVKPGVIKEYAQFSDRINSAPSPDALKQISDDFVGKLSADVDAKKITADQAQDAFKGFQSDVKDTYQTARYDANDAVTSAKQTVKDAHGARLQQVSGDVYDTIGQLKSDVQKGSKDALKTLDNSDAMIDLKPTFSKIDSTVADLQKSGTDESLAIADKLNTYKQRLIDNHGEAVPAPDAKKLIQGLDKITEYSPMAGNFDQAKNAAFKGVRGSLDSTLKGSVDDYAQKMTGVASDTNLLNRVSDFGDKQTGVGLLKNIQAPNQMERRAALSQLGQKYNTDFVAAVDPKNLPEQQILQKAQAAQDALRPDVVKEKMGQTFTGSRQQDALTNAKSGLDQAQETLAPFKSLAPNNAGQTSVQQKLETLAKGHNIELEGMFQKLGKLTDTDFVQAMHDQSIQAAFQKGATNGSRNTAFGAMVGYFFGGVPGLAGGASAGRVVDQWGPAMTKKVLDGMIRVSKNPTVESISNLSLPEPIKRNMVIGLENFMAKERQPLAGSANRKVASPPDEQQSQSGEDRWASQGVQKLGIQDQGFTQKLLSDPQAKRLLIQASDLKPGSKAMKNIQNQIQKGWGQ